ncbi:26257_t:CDS:1, partial [Racocetra persica]
NMAYDTTQYYPIWQEKSEKKRESNVKNKKRNLTSILNENGSNPAIFV